MRVEAAAWQGRPVFFEVAGPWRQESLATDVTLPNAPSPEQLRAAAVVILVAILIALRNVRVGRGDLTGATRLGIFMFLCAAVGIPMAAHHTPQLEEIYTLLVLFGLAFLYSTIGAALYIAAEPYVRRHWPQVLIAWSRGLMGQFRDPLVNGHILAGIAVGVASIVLHSAARTMTSTSLFIVAEGLGSPLGVLARSAAGLALPTLLALILLFAFMLLRLLWRRTWLAFVVTLLLIGSALWGATGSPIDRIADAVTAILLLTVSIRFGLLTLAVAMIVAELPGRYPITPDFSAFFAFQGWAAVLALLAVSLWSFRHALGGRRVLKTDLLDA